MLEVDFKGGRGCLRGSTLFEPVLEFAAFDLEQAKNIDNE
jgi:hypothetical protein